MPCTALSTPAVVPTEATRRRRQHRGQRTELRAHFVRAAQGVVLAAGGDHPGEMPSRLFVLIRHSSTPTASMATIGHDAHVAISWYPNCHSAGFTGFPTRFGSRDAARCIEPSPKNELARDDVGHAFQKSPR